ncbi:mannonate dehydratase [Blastopirellula marina]|uniref:mannonate dehydratase n=1 Tax=Blastopirellula marina DSM 3645 TaxID=314230 RepID=A3ZXG8_9BACT|nr:mannonate dehydratase [Blastopirellula marina]EAQ78758.1 D-mannonate dehydratase [Blastopirellula marina DSM 3645]
MQLTSVVTPLSDENLARVAQLGVTNVAIRYPGPHLDDLLAIQERLSRFGLQIAAVEGELPIQNAILGTASRDDDLAQMKQLLVNLGSAQIGVCCYNFMPASDWVRTGSQTQERGGAWTTSFRLADADQAASLHAVSSTHTGAAVTREQMWENLRSFLAELLPIAEKSGVALAMHPDDPPLAAFGQHARIMNSLNDFERLLELSSSPSNGICFCQGTFAVMGVDIPGTIRKLGDRIRYVHFRDSHGTADDFTEAFHDNGPTDMVAAMHAYHDIGFQGPIRPDHVPQLAGEEEGDPGYTMLARFFAFGYIRALMQSAEYGLQRR